MKATFQIDKYAAVIPMIQNVYAPEIEDNVNGWSWGFKYSSGVFEYFTYRTQKQAREECDRLLTAIDCYWCRHANTRVD